MPQVINSKKKGHTEGPTNNRREFAERGAYWGNNKDWKSRKQPSGPMASLGFAPASDEEPEDQPMTIGKKIFAKKDDEPMSGPKEPVGGPLTITKMFKRTQE